MMDRRYKKDSVLGKVREFFNLNRNETFKAADVASYLVNSIDDEYKKVVDGEELYRRVYKNVVSALNGQIDKKTNWKKVGRGLYKFRALP